MLILVSSSMTNAQFRNPLPLVMGWGDSNTRPTFLDSNWVDYTADGLGSGWYVRNAGEGGDTLVDMMARYTTAVGYWMWLDGYCVILGGLNDDQDGASVDTVYSRYKAACALASADGYLVLACVYPVEDNLMFTVNDSIQANWGDFADAIVDCSADAYIGEGAAHSGTYWYNSRHFSKAGHERFAVEYVIPAINALL